MKKLLISGTFILALLFSFGISLNLRTQLFLQLEKIYPQSESVKLKLARLYFYRGHHNLASIYFEKVLKLNPHSEKALLNIAWKSSRRGDYERSEKLFKTAFELNPNDFEITKGMVHNFVVSKKIESGVQFFKKFLENKKENCQGRLALASLYRKANKLLDSLSTLNQALPFCRSESQFAENQTHLGLFLVERKLGHFKKAQDQMAFLVKTQNYSFLDSIYMDEIIQKIMARGARLTLIQYPDMNSESLKELVGEQKVRVLDTLKLFSGLGEGDIGRFLSPEDGIHLTGEGSVEIAKVLAKEIIEQHP